MRICSLVETFYSSANPITRNPLTIHQEQRKILRREDLGRILTNRTVLRTLKVIVQEADREQQLLLRSRLENPRDQVVRDRQSQL